VLSELSQRLRPLSETPDLDASVLLAAVAGRTRAWVLAHTELALTPNQVQGLESALRRLERGEALPYVLGEWEFFGLRFLVTNDCLIPRPETECLVERALGWLRATPSATTALDVGTGSGCIAVGLAVNTARLRIMATEISKPALEVARRNARRHSVDDRITFVECDLLPRDEAQSEPGNAGPRFDLLCANLPYIPSAELRQLPVFPREPTLALDGGEDGLEPLRRLLSLAPPWLRPGGKMLLEVEATHGEQARLLAQAAFPGSEIDMIKDLAGRDRVLDIKLPG
jgi:release factor glutamine methyltransferase